MATDPTLCYTLLNEPPGISALESPCVQVALKHLCSACEGIAREIRSAYDGLQGESDAVYVHDSTFITFYF
jgi:hypothetical protein